MPKINRILIANRGEIACRIIRSAKKMGIESVAVYSSADRNALFVQEADVAYEIGPGPSSQSYLDMDKILDTAKVANADAIHPGYGFLSENAVFARKVTDAGLIFIGPPPSAITLMGSKTEAKETVGKINIPMVPGIEGSIDSVDEALEAIKHIELPVLIKASAGGGGKGMRIVHEEKELKSQLERAISEAVTAFGDGSVFIEKYIVEPKHIEVQIIGDHYGNILYLNERECSVQRRHQKVVEEAPGPQITPELRKQLGESAVQIAKACGYTNAGTVEFIMDREKNFYFLEMNTRLQVEHPVTEMTTGVDLVELQIKIAQGEELEIKQSDIKIEGHAIELRVYAEDPTNKFLPSIGTLTTYRLPVGEGVRVDNGYREGMEIPIFYDPMISKLSVWGSTREEAIDRLIQAIDQYQIVGIESTLGFGRYVACHPEFRSGDYSTHFVEQFYYPSLEAGEKNDDEKAASLVGTKLYLDKLQKLRAPQNGLSNWQKSRKTYR